MKDCTLLRTFILLTLVIIVPVTVIGQAPQSLLTDVNSDGTVSILAFGDSITFGVGDGGLTSDGNLTPDKGGYRGRLQNYLSVPVINGGVPGERITIGGIERFPRSVRSSNADVVIIMEGVNDTFFKVPTTEYRTALQTIINVAESSGKKVMLSTLPRPDADHSSLQPGVAAFNAVINELATVNDLNIAKVGEGWDLACDGDIECRLYNLPDGLHPTGKGYVAVAQSMAAGLLGIDIVGENGAQMLAEALGISIDEILVK